MTKQITDYVNEILDEPELKKMRDAIANGILLAYQDAIKNGNANMEVSQARGSYPTLAERLNKADDKHRQTDEQLAQKINKGEVSVYDIDKNKGKFDQTYMSEELLQQMAGTTPINAVPARRSLVPDQFAFPIPIGAKSKNLFDKKTVTVNKYVDYNTGSLVDTTGDYFYTSDWIEVSSNTEHVASHEINQVAFYDKNKIYISGLAGVSSFTTPENAAYIRLTINKSLANLDFFQLEIGTFKTPFKRNGIFIKKQDVEDAEDIFNSILEYNLLDKSRMITGYYIHYTT